MPLVYTEGFNPHPKIAYGPPVATGYASDGEYFDLHLQTETEFRLAEALNRQLPAGLEILEVKPLFGKSKSLSSLINRADYQIAFPGSCDFGAIERNIEKLLQRNSIVIERNLEGRKSRRLEVRPYLKHLETTQQGVFLQLNIENGQTVRVEEILRLLFPEDGSLVKIANVSRTGLWIQFGDLLASPMEL